MTKGGVCCSRYFLASVYEEKLALLAQGILYFCINSLANTLLASIWAADFVGPKICKPLAENSSTMPSAKGASGPTTVRSIPSSMATLTRDWISVGLMARFWAIWAVPAFPGAT
jgi:hypothetical protein